MIMLKKKDLNINFELNADDNFDVIKNIGLNETEDLIYSNEYFKMYFGRNYKSGSANIYIKSCVDNDYQLDIINGDFNTQGYMNDRYAGLELYDYSVDKVTVRFYPCNENIKYIKFDYEIKDKQLNLIKKDHVDLNFKESKVTTKYCMSQN